MPTLCDSKFLVIKSNTVVILYGGGVYMEIYTLYFTVFIICMLM